MRPLWQAQLMVAGAIAVLAVWWLTIRPSNRRDWQPEVAETSYAEIDGERVVIHNYRNFDYLSKTDFRSVLRQEMQEESKTASALEECRS